MAFLSEQVRIAARTICLNVLQVDEERVRDFLLQFHVEPVLTQLVGDIGLHLRSLDAAMHDASELCSPTASPVKHE